MKVLTQVSLEVEQKQWLRDTANEMGISMSAVVRKLIEEKKQ